MLWWTLRQLRSKSPYTKRRAIRTLGESNDSRAVEALMVALVDGDCYVRQEAEQVLMRHPNWWKSEMATRALPALVGALRDEIVREAATKALGKIDGNSAIELLTAALADKDPHLRRAVVVVLDQIPGSAAIELLMTALKDNDSNVQREAAEALGKSGDARAIGPLVAALTSPAREVAAKALERIDRNWAKSEAAKLAMPTLLAAIVHRDSDVWIAAAKALDRIDSNWRKSEAINEVFPAVVTALESSDSSVRKSTVRALSYLCNARAFELLLEALSDGDFYVRDEAAKALEGVDPGWTRTETVERTIPSIVAALNDTNTDLRAAAADALGRIADPRTVEPLVTALKDGEPSVRSWAAIALGKISDPRAVDPLLVALKEGRPVALSAAAALGMIADARATEPLVAILNGTDRELRAAAANALGRIADPCAVDPLVAALKDEYSVVPAAAALGMIGDARATQPLMAALKAKNFHVRMAAVQALGKIGTGAKGATAALLAACEVNETFNGESLRDAAEAALASIGATEELDAFRARKEGRASPCPRCGKILRQEKVTPFVQGRVCDSCGWATIWCYSCKHSAMDAIPEVWPDPRTPIQAWLECKACGKRARADEGILSWLESRGLL